MLNPSQIRARDYQGSNLLILAGAGAGKTETITARALNIAGNDGDTGLTLVTFTKKAATALKHRFEQVRGVNHQAFIGTFHSLCWRIIIDFGQRLQMDSTWAIMDQDDSLRLMKMCAPRLNANDCLKILSFARNSEMSVSDALNTPRFVNHRNNANLIIQATQTYAGKAEANKRLDFDSVLLKAKKLLSEFDDVRTTVQQQYNTLLVDEYQDTNLLQAQLLKNLNTGSNITVVGDDAQSIYSFRAARIENILEFQEEFDAACITLDINYRCPAHILEMAEASLSHNTQRLEREIRAEIFEGPRPKLIQATDQASEAGRIAREIENLINNGVDAKKICVLYRAARLSTPLQQALIDKKISFVLPEDDDFFAFPHIKSVMTVLRLATEPEDRVALAAIYDLLFPNQLDRLQIFDETAETQQASIWDIIEDSVGQEDPIRNLATRLASIRNNEHNQLSVAESLGLVIRFLEESLRNLCGGGSIWQLWLADLAILQTLAQPYSSVSDFLSSISTRNIDRNEDNDGVRFSTIHAAKGLEWDHVFIIGLVEFWFPMRLAIADLGNDEEERRLFYVASTRARKTLWLSTFKSSLNPYGQVMNQESSRFIDEVLDYIDPI